MENYSLSDIAAVANNDNCFGNGNSAWVLILLFAMISGNGFGFGRGGDYGQYATAASQQEILFGQQFQNLDNKLDRLGNGIADATFALNNSVTTEGRALQTQLANCCCENQRNTDALRYDMATMFARSDANVTAQTQKILDVISQNKIESLQSQVNNLTMQNAINTATAGVVKYPQATTYTSNCNPFSWGGCGCNNI